MPYYSSSYRTMSKIWAVISGGPQFYIFEFRHLMSRYAGQEVRKSIPMQGGNENQRAESIEPGQGAIPMTCAGNNSGGRDKLPIVAAKLKRSCDDGAFHHMVIVAPQETANALRASLGEQMKSRILPDMPAGYVYDDNAMQLIIGQDGQADFAPIALKDVPVLASLLRQTINLVHNGQPTDAPRTQQRRGFSSRTERSMIDSRQEQAS